MGARGAVDRELGNFYIESFEKGDVEGIHGKFIGNLLKSVENSFRIHRNSLEFKQPMSGG